MILLINHFWWKTLILDFLIRNVLNFKRSRYASAYSFGFYLSCLVRHFPQIRTIHYFYMSVFITKLSKYVQRVWCHEVPFFLFLSKWHNTSNNMLLKYASILNTKYKLSISFHRTLRKLKLLHSLRISPYIPMEMLSSKHIFHQSNQIGVLDLVHFQWQVA